MDNIAHNQKTYVFAINLNFGLDYNDLSPKFLATARVGCRSF